MQGLSSDIQSALDVVIEGLDYKFEVDLIEPDKIKESMDSKLDSFRTAKELLEKWVNSPNAPGEKRFSHYVQRIIDTGESSVEILRKALRAKVDFSSLEEHKHKKVAKTKLEVLKSVYEMDSSLQELKLQLETGTVNLKEAEFERGWAEKFAYGEFYPVQNYNTFIPPNLTDERGNHFIRKKEWYNEEEDAIIIDPRGTRGEIVTLGGLKIQLPSVPRDKSKILFSDKSKKDQYWRREPLPKGCTPSNVEAYTEYILEEFRRRREGLWFMNNGKPVWLTPWHYVQLQWGKMKDGDIYPSYREAQRDLSYHKLACWVDPRCMGQIFLKSRQTGYTYGALSDSLCVVTSSKNSRTGLTSMTDDDAERAWEKLAYTYQEWPFFFQPVLKGRIDSPVKYEWKKPSNNTKEQKKKKDTSNDGYVNSVTDYDSTKAKAYDGQTLLLYIGDESAKWERENYIEHVNTLLPTTFRGGRVVGKMFLGSTMGKLDKGGEQFKTLYLKSKVEDRMESGFTYTKLYAYFMPAQTNYEEAIDKYGKCWEEAPPKGTLNVFGREIKKGSIEMIQDLYEEARNTDDVALNAAYRAFPMTEEHAMRDEAEECVFNLTKLMDQWDSNVADRLLPVTRGNFTWKDGKPFTEAIFQPDERGRFKVHWMPNESDGTAHLRNNVALQRNLFVPQNDYGAIGVDCYGSFSKGANRQSKGAAHAVTKDKGRIPQGVPANRFLFEYVDKPATQDIFDMEILCAAWFYGLPILAENNRRDHVRFLYNNRCRPFSMNRVDKLDISGDDLVLGGQPMTSKDIKDSHENAIRTYIIRHVGHATEPEGTKYRKEGEMGIMPFNETIMSWQKFNPASPTEYDATISSGLALIACDVEKYKPSPKKRDPKKYVSLLRKYKNNGNISIPVRNG